MSFCFHPRNRRPTRTCPSHVASGSVDCSTITTARPHEYFDLTGSTHRQGYFGIAMVGIVGPTLALAAVIALGSVLGAF